MVGAKGFEPSTSWSRTRFQSLLKSTEFCCPDQFDNKLLIVGLLGSMEFVRSEVPPQLQNHLQRLIPSDFRWNFTLSGMQKKGTAQISDIHMHPCAENGVPIRFRERE